MAQSNSPYNSAFEDQFDPERAQLFIITKLLRSVHTATLVQVQAVQPTSDRVGFVTVQPMILNTDTTGVVIAQSPIYNVPYMRLQGGTSAVILDPVIGDIGLAIFAERDITNVKKTLKPGAPATDRFQSSADGLYLGGCLNPAPTQYVQFQPSGAGITITTPGNIALNATGTIAMNSGGTTTITATSGLVINANTTFNGNISGTTTGAGSVQFAAPIKAPDMITPTASFNTHVHGGVQTGGGNTGGPHN